MGVGSAAFATILSQFVSAILCLTQLLRSPEEYRIDLKKIRFHGFYLKQIIQTAFLPAFRTPSFPWQTWWYRQTSTASAALAMAGCGAYSKIEGFGFPSDHLLRMSLTTFISQNLGAGQYERAKKGPRFGILCSVIMAELVGLVINLAAPLLIAAFRQDPDVIAYGVAQARTVTLF